MGERGSVLREYGALASTPTALWIGSFIDDCIEVARPRLSGVAVNGEAKTKLSSICSAFGIDLIGCPIFFARAILEVDPNAVFAIALVESTEPYRNGHSNLFGHQYWMLPLFWLPRGIDDGGEVVGVAGELDYLPIEDSDREVGHLVLKDLCKIVDKHPIRDHRLTPGVDLLIVYRLMGRVAFYDQSCFWIKLGTYGFDANRILKLSKRLDRFWGGLTDRKATWSMEDVHMRLEGGYHGTSL